MATYLFDFDGTLVDSMPAFVKAFTGILKRFDIPEDKNFVKTITPLGFMGSIRYVLSLGVPMTADELVKELGTFFVGVYTNEIEAKPHVKETLEALKARGDRLYVLTASSHAALDPCLKRCGLYALFENVWSCDDFGTTKADPAIYRMAAERIGKPAEEIIFLDDNLDADKTAKSAGMRVYGVFDESSLAFADEIRAVTDRYITDFSELLEE